jgi:hypothetical protein
MKWRTEMAVIGVVAGVAVIFAMKHGAGPQGRSGGGRACCPTLSGLNLWPTNPWVGIESTNRKPGVTASESITNRPQ